MASGGSDTSSLSQTSTSPKAGNILTGSDLVKGGDAPILLASDTLGRVGLLRYPAHLPEPPAPPLAPKEIAGEGIQFQICRGGVTFLCSPSHEELNISHPKHDFEEICCSRLTRSNISMRCNSPQTNIP